VIETPFASLDEWVAYFGQAELPVLRHTVTELERLRDDAENVNGRVLAGVIVNDPLMTLRLLAYIEANRRERQNTDITTIERALVMIGIGPFFRNFQNLPILENQLKTQPKALLGLLKVIARGRKASRWAREWAILRHDLDVEEITLAALLHDAGEILMWCFAPALALKVRDMQTRDHALRSAAAQTEAFGIRLHDLQLAMAKTWRLPMLLTTLMDDAQADNPRVKNVILAVDLARHSANGWEDAALPDDYTAISALLHINVDTVLHKIGVETPPVPPTDATPP
jgi:HD-like signal output (HDOD) protein